MQKNVFLVSILSYLCVLLTFVLEITSNLGTFQLMLFLFFTIGLANLVGNFLFQKYKSQKISPPTMLTTYAILIIVGMIFLTRLA